MSNVRAHVIDQASRHTGRELELMLAGRKPLAMFYALTHELPCKELIPEEAFRPHVEAGLLSREDLDLETTAPDGAPVVVRYVFYATLGQEWRMHVMSVLRRAVNAGCGWNETCERIEGTLLGYTPQENDTHCARMFRSDAL